MATLRLGLGALVLIGACTPIAPATNTFPQQPEPTQVTQMSGPPGGYVDPGYGYPQQQPQQPPQEAAGQPGYPQGYQDGYQQGYAPATEDQAAADTANGGADPEPSATPGDPGYDMGEVTDGEITATLDAYGSWEDSDDYGRIWRPDTTQVGVDFTPYETDGSWIWSDAGWNYSCDYNWGWLPFHYGRWGWFDNHWGWQPGHQWTSAAVEWRGGGGYTGWRPLSPLVRDHRHPETSNSGHRGGELRDSQWRFAADKDFGHGHIRGHLFQNPAEGLRVTSSVSRPAVRGNYAPVSSASIMRGRISSQAVRGSSPTFRNNTVNNNNVNRPQPQGFRQQQTTGPIRGNTPTWRPQQQQTYRPQQQQNYRPQQQQSYRPTYQAPQRSYSAPARNTGSYRPQYSAPSRSYSPPARSYSAPSRSYTPTQSHSSSSSSSGGGGFHPSSSGGGGGGHSGGGGGRHR